MEKYIARRLNGLERAVISMMKQGEGFGELKREYESRKVTEEQALAVKDAIRAAKLERRRRRRNRSIQLLGTMAACLGLLVILPNTSGNMAYAMSRIPMLGKWIEVVTFRDYQYEDEKNVAQVQVPELVFSSMSDESLEAGTATEEKQKIAVLDETLKDINSRVEEISAQLVAEFQKNLNQGQGYQSIAVSSEVIQETEDYFTLKLICYQGAGSGAQWNYFYTVDLNTGKLLELKDLFVEGADYITPVSDEIKRQMREQMAADEGVKYWLDDPEVSFWEFRAISEETSFYLDEANRLVICFDEGDVGPMSMGCPEFVIPEEVIADICRPQ